MNNWKTDFEVKFHLEFTHVNGKKEAKYNSLIVEAENEEKAVDSKKNEQNQQKNDEKK